jgi:hypothetical protein
MGSCDSFDDQRTGDTMAKMVKCEMCGTKTHHGITKEFDGRLFYFCCRACLEVYGLMRAEGLVQTKAEDDFFSRTARIDVPLKGVGQAGHVGNEAAGYPAG